MRLSVIGTRGFPGIEGGVEKHCEALYPLFPKDIDITVYRRKPYVTDKSCCGSVCFLDFPSTTVKGFETVLHSFLVSVDALLRKPDIVHYHNIGPALFSPIVKLRKIPVVLTYHSANYEHKKWGAFARKVLLFSEKVALSQADRIIFVNRFQMEKYPESIRKKSVYLPNGIRAPYVSGRSDFLEQLGVEKSKYILAVGRITPEKDYETLISAFREAAPEGFKLVIAGSAGNEEEYLERLKHIADGLDVVFPGFVFGENLAQLYSHARLFILSSKNEGFPLVLLEAMSYGLDMLVSDISGTHLVDLDDDDYFVLGDYRSLASKIVQRLAAEKRREYDLTLFDWKEIANRTSEIIHEAAGKQL